MKIRKRDHWVTATPPDDKVILCPECSGTVESLVIHAKGRTADHFATYPCEHVHDIELLDFVTGRER